MEFFFYSGTPKQDSRKQTNRTPCLLLRKSLSNMIEASKDDVLKLHAE